MLVPVIHDHRNMMLVPVIHDHRNIMLVPVIWRILFYMLLNAGIAGIFKQKLFRRISKALSGALPIQLPVRIHRILQPCLCLLL